MTLIKREFAHRLKAYREKLRSGEIKLDPHSSHPSIREFKYKLHPQWWGYRDSDIEKMFESEYKVWLK